MAKNSKVTGITLECGYDMWAKENKKYEENIYFHRKGIPTRHKYELKKLDHNRLRKILHQADSNYIFFGLENVLLQYHYEHKFYNKKWFKKFVNIFYYGYWAFIWVYVIYILYLKFVIGE